jgi:hypothetical protein
MTTHSVPRRPLTGSRSSRLALPLPREHGTWAWLLVPLVVGAGVADRSNLPVLFLALSVVFGFLARVPAELAFRQDARRMAYGGWAILFGAIAAGGVTVLLTYYERWWLLPLGAPVIVGPLVVVSSRALRFRWRDFGELLVVACFAALAPAAHYAAVGSLKATGLSLWLLSALYSGSSVFYIRMLLSGTRESSSDSARPDRRLAILVYHVTLVVLVTLAVLVGDAPPLVVVAFAPLLIKVTWRMIRLPDHLDLRKTGLFEVSQAAAFAILLVAAYRVS